MSQAAFRMWWNSIVFSTNYVLNWYIIIFFTPLLDGKKILITPRKICLDDSLLLKYGKLFTIIHYFSMIFNSRCTMSTQAAYSQSSSLVKIQDCHWYTEFSSSSYLFDGVLIQTFYQLHLHYRRFCVSND